MTADFHIHTRASDGLLSPEEVVKTACAAGLGIIAVTDHDTVFNTLEVGACCEKYNIKSVPGVEISAYDGTVKTHTLGYGFDLENPRFKTFLNNMLTGSELRLKDILEKLDKEGVYLTYEEISAERISKLTPVHAMHIGRAGVKRGYANNPFDFYKKFLMPGSPAFSDICRPTPEEAIKAITEAGGIAVLAHPGRIYLNKNDLRALIERLAAAGLKGIEAVYSTHTVNETAYFKEIAEDLGLYVTGGSDSHSNGGNRRIGLPVFRPSAELRQRLKI